MNNATTSAEQVSDTGPGMPKYMGPVEFLRILRRRKKLIALTIALITGLTALTLSTITPLYKSEALVIVESPEGPDDDPDAAIAKARENEIRVTSFQQLLQSRAMAGLVVRDLGLDDDREFNPNADPDKPVTPTGPVEWLKSQFLKQAAPLPVANPNATVSDIEKEKVIDRLMENLVVAQVNRSNILKVSAYSANAKKAQRIANKLVTVTMGYQISKRQNNSKDTIASLTTRVASLRKQVLDADARVADYRKSHGIADDMSGQLQMDRLSSELTGARTARAEAEARSRTLDATGAGATGISSPILADLQTQEITLQRRIAELSSLYGQGHPDMINAKAQLAEVQRRLRDEVGRVGSSLQAETAVRRDREAQISGDLGALRAQSFQKGIASVALMDLMRDAETNRTLYVSLLSRLKELERQDPITRADANIESRAALSQSPTYPATKRILAVAVIASIIIAAILAFAAESIDSHVRTSEQVEQLTGMPAMTMIPEIPENWGDLPPYVAITERPCSAFSESLRSMQLELASRHTDKATQIVVITSPLPGEGKTTISMSLAAAGAASGIESVIVDLDLRRPGLKNMEVEVATGADLLDFLEGRASLNEILRYDPRVPRLAMIGVKRAAKDPGAMLSSQRLSVLIGELAKRYRFVILNTAPILPVRDAKLLATYADDVLMVVQWAKTPPDALRTATRILGSKLTGALLNRVDYKKHAALAYGDAIQHYSKYSVYYGDDTREPETADVENGRVAGWRKRLTGIRTKAA